VVTNSAGGVRENRSSAIAGGEYDRGMTTFLEIKAAKKPKGQASLGVAANWTHGDVVRRWIAIYPPSCLFEPETERAQEAASGFGSGTAPEPIVGLAETDHPAVGTRVR
jgi:hypothetical protein